MFVMLRNITQQPTTSASESIASFFTTAGCFPGRFTDANKRCGIAHEPDSFAPKVPI